MKKDSVQTEGTGSVKQLAEKTKGAIVGTIDQNGNGQIDIEDIIIIGLKVPGICIDRTSFLRKELQMKYPTDVIEDAVANNPMYAGIPVEEIDKIAESVIKFERNCVSTISAALGMPGFAAMPVTLPAELAQYYGYMLRAAQKLMYLYGFPQIEVDEAGTKFDSATINMLVVCIGVMCGIAGANRALSSLAKALALGVEKQLLKMHLTRGTLYPIVRMVARWFNVRMTRTVFAGFFKKLIPYIGGVIGGGLTFLSFKPCCDKLKAVLSDTILSNPDYNPLHRDDDLIIADGEVEAYHEEEAAEEAPVEDGAEE